MKEWIRLTEESIGAYLVTKKIARTGLDKTEKVLLKKSSSMVSSVVSLAMVAVNILVMVWIVAFLAGYAVSQWLDSGIFLFVVPLIISFVITGIFWYRRSSIFSMIVLKSTGEHL